MPVPDQTPAAAFTGNGATTVFPFAWGAGDASHVVVKVDAVEQAQGVDYTVTALDGSSGEVTFASAPASLAVVMVYRVTPLERLTDYQDNGALLAQTLDDDIDAVWRAMQDFAAGARENAAAVRAPSGESVQSLPAAADRANKVLTFDATGEPVATVPDSGTAVDVLTDLADTASALTGDALIGVKHTATGAVGRTQHAKNLEIITPEDFGAVGNGSTDDVEPLQAALNAAIGKRLVLRPGANYVITAQVAVGAGTVLIGYGATITDTTHGTMLNIGSGVVIAGLTLVGAGAAYNAAGIGIYASGTRNGASVAPTMTTGIRIIDCTLRNLGGYGISLSFASDVIVRGCKISSCGYAGVLVYSGENVLIEGCTIDTLAGETGSGELNAYGVAFTSLVNTSDFVRDPQSTRCRAVGNLIRNIPTWHALDTHGGTHCEFIGNQIIDCRRGVAITNLTTRGASHCLVAGNSLRNTLTGTNSNGSEKQGEAIWDVGYSASVRNARNRITGNLIYQHGVPDEALAAIYVSNAEDGSVDSNTLVEPYNFGILIDVNVRRYSVRNNAIADPKGAGVAGGGPTDYPTCLRFVGSDWTGIDVSHNTFTRRNSAVATKVGEIGVMIANTAAKSIRFARNAFDGLVADWSFSDITGLTGDLSGTFTGTLTGCTTSPTGTVRYRIVDGVVTLSFESDITATSNSTAMTITGLPAFLTPAANRYGLVCTKDNGSGVLGVLIVGTGTTMTFYQGVGLGAWTSSGTKGVTQCSVTYQL